MKKNRLVGFLFTIVVIGAIFWGITQRAYPVAIVNGAFVSARSFADASVAAENYYRKMLAVYGGVEAPADEFASMVRRTALQSLIEDSLVYDELKELYEEEPLRLAVNRRVGEAFASAPAISEAVEGMFGLPLSQVSEIIFAPQARAEILRTDMGDEAFDVWLQKELQDAEVEITLNDLQWANGQVELTGAQPYTAEVKKIFEELASTTQTLQEAIEADMASSSSEE